MTLSELDRLIGLTTDKGRAGLWPFYEELFAGRRQSVRGLIELGVKEGGALAVYAAYFDRALCLGIEPKMRQEETFGERLRAHGLSHRVGVKCGRAENRAFMESAIVVFGGDGPDIVIDDASHLLAPTRAALEILWPRVAPGGLYVVEDWHAGEWRPEKYGAGGGLRALLQECLDALISERAWLAGLRQVTVGPRAFALEKGNG